MEKPKYLLDFKPVYPNAEQPKYQQFRCKKCGALLPNNELSLAYHWAGCFGPKLYILPPERAN